MHASLPPCLQWPIVWTLLKYDSPRTKFYMSKEWSLTPLCTIHTHWKEQHLRNLLPKVTSCSNTIAYENKITVIDKNLSVVFRSLSTGLFPSGLVVYFKNHRGGCWQDWLKDHFLLVVEVFSENPGILEYFLFF